MRNGLRATILHASVPPCLRAFPPVIALLACACVVAASPNSTAQDTEPKPAKAGATHELRPKFEEGRTSQYDFRGKRTTNTVATGPRGEIAVRRTMDSEGRVLWTVEQVNADGSASCVMTLQWLTLTIVHGDNDPNVIDSREQGDDDDGLARRIAAFVAKPLRCEVGADGTVLSISGVDAIRAAIEQAQNAGGPVEDEMFLEQASTLATIPGIQSALELDATWQSSNTWSRDYGKIHEPMDYQLTSVEQIAGIPIVTVNARTDLGFEPDEEKLGGGRIDIQMTEGQSTAQIIFDTQRHEVIGRNSVESFRIQISANSENLRFTSVVDEHIQSQLVRVAEEE